MKKHFLLIVITLIISSCSTKKKLTTNLEDQNFNGQVKSINSFIFTFVQQDPIKYFSKKDFQSIQELSDPFVNETMDDLQNKKRLFNKQPVEEYSFNKKGNVEKVVLYLQDEETVHTQLIKKEKNKTIIFNNIRPKLLFKRISDRENIRKM